MTSLKTSIKTITYLSDIGCLEIQGGQSSNDGLEGVSYIHTKILLVYGLYVTGIQEKTSCSVKRIPKQNAKHS